MTYVHKTWSINTLNIQKGLFFHPSCWSSLARCRMRLRSCCDAAQLTYPKPLPTGPQHSIVARPRATSGWQGICWCRGLEIFKLLRDLVNLELEFVGNALKIKHILMHRVGYPNFTVNHLSTLLYHLQRYDCFNIQIPTDFLKLI